MRLFATLSPAVICRVQNHGLPLPCRSGGLLLHFGVFLSLDADEPIRRNYCARADVIPHVSVGRYGYR